MRKTLVATALLAALSLLWTTRAFLVDPPLPSWDEGVHLERARGAAETLGEHSPRALLLWMSAPSYYPFLQPLATGLIFRLIPPGEAPARLVALLATLALVPLLALLARRLFPASGALTATLAVALTLSSAELMRLEGRILLDPAGSALTTALALAWLGYLERCSWSRAAVVALLLLAAFFTKYNYGIVAGLGLLIHSQLLPGTLARSHKLAVLLAAPALAWLWQEPEKKMALLLEYARNRAPESTLAERLSFPLVSFARDHAATPLIGVALLAGFLWALRRLAWRAPVGVLLVLPVVQLLAIGASRNQLPRYLMPAMPLALLAVAGAVVGTAGAGQRKRRLLWLAALTLGLSLLRSPGSLFGHDPAWRERGTLRALHAEVAALEPSRPLLLLGAFDGFSPTLPRPELGSVPLFVACPAAYQATRARLLPASATEIDRAVAAALAAYRARHGSPVPVLRLDLAPDSPLRDDDYQRWNQWQEPVAARIAVGDCRPLLEEPTRTFGLSARLCAIP